MPQRAGFTISMSDKKMARKAQLIRLVRRGFDRKSTGLKAEEIAKLVLANSMAERRRLVKKRSQGAGGNAQHNAAISRFANDRARALKKTFLQSRQPKINPAILMKSMMPSPLLDNIDPDRPSKWKKVLSRKYKSIFPRIALSHLNFLDFPVETMNELQRLSLMEREEVNAYLDFDGRYCDDIGAFLVISEIWPQLSRVFRGGRMSMPIQKVLDAVGLGRDLNITLNGVTNHDNVWPFELRRRRPRGSTQSPYAQLQPQGREQLNDKLTTLIDQWLEVASINKCKEEDSGDHVLWKLTGDGKANIANMVGEILDNAERHSSPDSDGDWSMAAFMAKREEDGQSPDMKCYLAFLSVGTSIAEAIRTAPQATRDYCGRYASYHARPGQSYETLLTIAALQDGVTSKHDAVRNGRGGTGLQDTLDFIGELGGAPEPSADVRVTIVSGKSCVRLRHPILVGTPGDRGQRVQWCNEANDPTYPPDHNIAFDLPAHFAGTLVTVAFTLDPSIFVPGGDDDGQGND